ncbi:hypothetical protein [Caulobacter sp. Root1472]|uniref:head-tail joining protein n=1 Tax=Caulobacter sp. Root1472 TaxID=1736470 RepID=UPI0006FC7EC1|nr:hypothetical protein [Caulobacter sp. Root1472]KQZ31722.1 hypothetical protein ASD47_15740 [Caulobacter sp. Root1472]
MSPVADRRARLLAAVYASYGEDAAWTPGDGSDPVRIKREEAEQDLQLGRSRVQVDTIVLRVRRSEVSAPSKGDQVVTVETAEAFSLIAKPKLERFGLEWICEAVRL